MSNETESRRRGRPIKTSKSMDEIQTEQSVNELQTLFEDLEGAVKVTVTRLGPHSYATGHCGIFHVGSGKQISIEEVARRFGGGQFMLVSRDSNGGQIKAKKQIEISGPPLYEGKRIYPNGEVEEDRHLQVEKETKPAIDPEVDLLMKLVQAGASPEQIRASTMALRGFQMPAYVPPPPQPVQEKNSPLDLANQQLTMQIMQQIMQMSNDMQRHNMENIRQMREYRDDAAQSVKPADPLGDVKTMLAVMQELKSAQSVVGNDAQSAIASALPLIAQTISEGLGEFFAYKSASATAQLTGMQEMRANRPALEPRLPAMPETDDVVSAAREMGLKFRSLDAVGKQRAMKAFLSSAEQNVDDDIENDIMESNGDSDFLGPEDRALLNGDHDGNQGDNISDGNDTAAAALNYQVDSPRH